VNIHLGSVGAHGLSTLGDHRTIPSFIRSNPLSLTRQSNLLLYIHPHIHTSSIMADAISAVAPLVAAVSGTSSSTAPNGELTEFERLPPNDDDGADGTGLFSWLSSLVRSGSANLPPAELTTASSTANISRPRVITVSSASATPPTTTSGTTATASMHYQASSSMMTTTTSTSAAAYSSSSSSSSSSASVSIQETPAATTTSLFASFFSSPTPPPPQPQPQPAAASTPSRTARLHSMAVVPNTPSVASPSSSNQLQPQSEYAASPSPHRQTQQDTTSSSSSPSPKNLKPFTSVPNLRDQLQQLHSSSSSSSSSAQSPSPVSSPSTPVNPYESMPASGGAGTPQHREAVTESAAPVRPAGVMRTRSQVAQNSPLRGKPRAIPREVSLAIAPRSERVSE